MLIHANFLEVEVGTAETSCTNFDCDGKVIMARANEVLALLRGSGGVVLLGVHVPL